MRAIVPLLLLSVPAPAAAASIRVAVMDFTDAAPGGGSFDSLGKGLQSMLTTDLAESSAFELVERARLKDIESELRLQRRAEIDPKTAVRIGKLAGASHLVSGSLTVFGDKMRIDCRVVAVENGQVLLAEKVEGEKAAFFELEKTLVQKVVAAAGARVAPKERAQMGRVHTADFDAFKKFSDGIAQFDDKKYDEAVQSMREATQIDAEFKLAHVTLAGYEELIARARSQRDAARDAEAELKQLQLDKTTRMGAEIVARLQQIARSGDKRQKLTAVLLLGHTYSSVGGMHGPLQVLRERGDEFAHNRTADNYYRAYWAQAAEAFPHVPPLPGYVQPPDSLDKFDQQFAKSVSDLEKSIKSESLGINFVYNGIQFAERLHYDHKQTTEMLERAYRLLLKLNPPAEWRHKRMIELAERFQLILELDRSTAYLTQLQGSTQESEILKRVVELLEQNRELAKLLADEKKHKVELRELLRTASNHDGLHTIREARKIFANGDDLTYEMVEPLVRHRGFPRYDNEYLLINNEPFHPIRNAEELSVGPMSDRARAAEIRYWKRHPSERPDGSLLLAATPLHAGRIKFALAAEPALDWRLAEKHSYEVWQKMPEQHPTVSVLFGVEHIHQQGQPLHGFAVRLARDGVRVVEITDSARQLTEKPLAEWRGVDATGQNVSLGLDGQQLKLEIGTKTWSTPMPKSQGGFVGFWIQGTGWTAVTDLQIIRPGG
jgi:TolB-like protein